MQIPLPLKLPHQKAHSHTQRWKRFEKFLREIGLEPAESTSRNPLESPWALGEQEFKRRMKTSEFSKNSEVWTAYQSAREETLSLTEEAGRVEAEIDERVRSLYGV